MASHAGNKLLLDRQAAQTMTGAPVNQSNRKKRTFSRNYHKNKREENKANVPQALYPAYIDIAIA